MKNSMLKVTEMEAGGENFKLIPISSDCPYIEVRFSLEKKILTILSKDTFDDFKMMVKITDDGEVAYTKSVKGSVPKPKYERLRSVSFYDYSITVRSDIEKFVDFITGESNDLSSYFIVAEKIEAPLKVLDKDGK